MDPGVLAEPGLEVGVLVRGVVVHDHVQLPARVGARHHREELGTPRGGAARSRRR